MTPTEVIVVFLAGALAVGQWWLFVGRRPRLVGGARGARVQEVHVRLQGGFEPDVIPVEAGKPVRLVFFRDESVTRADRLIFDRPSINEILPAYTPTPVEFTPEATGDYPFRCGHAARGLVIASAPADGARANLGRGHTRHG